MKLLFLGSGSATTVGAENFQSNMLLIAESNDTLLIDCGSDIRFSLYKQNKTHRDINNVYISHLHADHAGGLEWLAISTKFDPNCSKKPDLFISETLADDLWNKTLSGGLGTLQCEIAQLDSYFSVHRVPLNGSFCWEDSEFHIVQTIHALNGYSLMPSFGLFCELADVKVLITSDTQFFPHQMMPLYERADVIFHDCETFHPGSGVHAHYNQLKGLPAKIKHKMWLYHYNPGKLPDAKSDGFLGFVACGQCFDFRDPGTYLS
jgi:ribonuclease BN (tRNA processing enzyme)